MSPFRKLFFRPLQTWEELPKHPAILWLDERTLQKIYQHLHLVDQVCLSLSCKQLFALFGEIAKHKSLEFPRLLYIRQPIMCVNSEDVVRNQLLLRLENHRWAYCGKCLRLHPRKELSRHALRDSAIERPCTFYAGIVDLCPCISLTIRAREKLVKILKSPAKSNQTKYGPFEYRLVDGENPRLRHCCTYKCSIQTDYDMTTALVLFIANTGQLSVQAEHTLCMSPPKSPFRYEACFACPHVNLFNFLRSEVREYSLPRAYKDLLSLAPGKQILKACYRCYTLVTKHEIPGNMNQARFWVTRDLGGCKWPTDRAWFDQCRLTGFNFWINDIYGWTLQFVSSERRNIQIMWKKNYYLRQKRRFMEKRRQSEPVDASIDYINDTIRIAVAVPSF
ncbi:unnamed protein product [Penicillium olsonii]|uniref:F-box domain-containing protein n=1 Tax=Penicillium olsonii TaxID=99116 RepID=A0A9W4IHD2_PENOL|nr:unnamed protein product [Penicillium olsonii]CAG8278432.1 unnamed protein product [Penicillium olsonii]